MNLLRLATILCAFSLTAFAGGKEIALSLGLNASSKAIKQWEKVFIHDGKMAKYGIDTLSDSDKKDLKSYLTSHAADSDHPEAAGL